MSLHLEALLDETDADEIIATAQIYDHAARSRSFEIAVEMLADFVRPNPVRDYSPAGAAQ